MKDRHDEVQDLFDDESPEMHNDIEEKRDGFDTAEEDFDDELDDSDFDEDELDDEDFDDEEADEKPKNVRSVSRDFEDEDENDELFTRRNYRGGGYSGGGNSYVKYGILAAVAIAVILLIIFLFRGKSDDKASDTAGEGTTAVVTSAGENVTVSVDYSAYELEKDTNPEVGTLMNSFYTARQTADLSAMTNLVDSTVNLSAQKLEKMKEYIEEYTNLSCYTKDGLKDGEYLVYVYCDVKFLNIETLAPDLQWYYVKTAEDGHLYICTEMTEEENTFAQEQGTHEEVRALVQDVNDRLSAAMASDSGLDSLVKILNGEGDGSGETSPASDTSAAAQDTTAAPDTTSAAETTAAPQTTTAPEATAAASDSITVWAVDGPYAIRKEPSRESDQIGSIYKGDHASRTELGSEWSKIEYVNAEGETVIGYVLNEALTTTSPE